MKALLLVLLIHCSFPSVASLTYTPRNLDSKKAQLVVVIHGCLQSSESMAMGAGWNQMADLHQLVIHYPQVSKGSNMMDCWNWFMPDNQKKDSGQLKELRDEILTLKNNLKIPEAPVFLAGISSGGAMVAGLLACFPEDFKAGAVHSGPSYGLAQSLLEGDKVLREGPPEKTTDNLPCQPKSFGGSVLVIHGSADKVVNPKHVDRIVSDFIDGAKAMPPLLGTDNGHSFKVINWVKQGKVKGRVVIVNGLDHAWTGANLNWRSYTVPGQLGPLPTEVPFFSEKGPSATNLMWDFFRTTTLIP